MDNGTSSDNDFSFRKQRLRAFEPTLGLRAGLVEDLIQQDDDWSFVIKAHAIVEAAITQLLGQLIVLRRSRETPVNAQHGRTTWEDRIRSLSGATLK